VKCFPTASPPPPLKQIDSQSTTSGSLLSQQRVSGISNYGSVWRRAVPKGPKVQFLFIYFYFFPKSIQTFLLFTSHLSLFIVIQIKNYYKTIFFFSLFHAKQNFSSSFPNTAYLYKGRDDAIIETRSSSVIHQ
jgi:hypothetical protein